MFNQRSIINEVNIINKIVCYLIVILMAIICKKVLFTLFVDIFFLLITKQYSKLFKFNILTTLLILLCIPFPQLLWISKIFLLIIYTILLTKVTSAKEARYIIENTLYKLKNKKITYRFSYMIYFYKNFKRHFKRMLVLKDDYDMKLSLKLLFFIIKQSYKKAHSYKEEFDNTNSIRFYNYSSERTNIEKLTWESWDTNYILSHIILLVITIIYGG